MTERLNITKLLFLPQGIEGLNIEAFCCGRLSVDEFFKQEAQDYQDELFGEPQLLKFYQQNGLNFFFSNEQQEMEYRNWNPKKDGKLETRLMYRDLILLKRDSIRK